LLVVQRRDARGASRLRGVRYTRVGEGASVSDLTTYDEWRTALLALGVSLDGVSEEELRALHARMLERHASYLQSSRRS
jgi:hypothetical protein